MKKIVLILLLSPVFSFAQEEWELVTTSKGGDNFYIKDVAEKSYSSKITFWQKTKKPDTYKPTKKDDIYKAGDYVVVKYEGDCTDKTLLPKIMVHYNKDGSPKVTLNGPFDETPVIPDSVGETFLLTACNKFSN